MSAIQNSSAYFAAAFRSSSTDSQKAAVLTLEDQFLLNRSVTQGRKCQTDLEVPYSHRQFAYVQGARRDHHRKIWCAPASTPLWKVAIWLKEDDVCKPASLDHMRRFIATSVKQECSMLHLGVERLSTLQEWRKLALLYDVVVKPEDLFLFAATAERPKECVARLRTTLTQNEVDDERLGVIIRKAGELFIPRWRLNGNHRVANSLCQLVDLTTEYCGQAAAKNLVLQAIEYRRMPTCPDLMKRCLLLGVE